MQGWIEYSADLFDQSTAELLGRRLESLLDQVVADPARSDRARSTSSWLPSGRPFWRPGTALRCRWPSGSTTVPALFAAQVAASPDAIAVTR